MFDEIGVDYHQFSQGKSKFPIKTFYPIRDCLIAELKRRSKRYHELNDYFGILFNYSKMKTNEIYNAADELRQRYKNDLDESFGSELVHFIQFICEQENAKDPSSMYKIIKECSLESPFPNVCIPLQICLTLPSTNASGERSFSTIKRIKNYLRSRYYGSKPLKCLNNIIH